MPLSEKQKRETLEELRQLFNFTDDDFDFVKEVKNETDEICEDCANIGVANWPKRFLSLMDWRNYTYGDIAKIIGVHHRTIQDVAKNTTIEPFYIEILSLIFQLTPYELIWEIPDSKDHPMVFLNSQIVKITEILWNCFDVDSPEKIEKLKAIIKIGKLSTPKYQQLYKAFECLEILDRIRQVDPFNAPDPPFSTATINMQISNRLDELEGQEKYDLDYMQTEFNLLVSDLQRYDPRRLKEMAQLVLADDEVAVFIRLVMLTLGFPENSISLRHYDVESCINGKQGITQHGKRTRDVRTIFS